VKTTVAAFIPALAVALCIITADGDAAASSRPVYGGTLAVAMGEPVTTLDPPRVYVTSERKIASLVYETLFEEDHDGVRPALVETWNAGENNTVWTFTLKAGITFHDGSSLSAADAVYSLQRALASRFDLVSGADFSPLWEAEITAEGAGEGLTVRIGLKAPAPDLPRLLAHPAFAVLPEPPPHDGTTRVTPLVIPAGTGPYCLSEGTTSSQVELVAYEGHRDGRPFVDRLVWKLEQLDEASIELQAGAVDMYAGPPFPAWKKGERDRIAGSTHTIYLAFNPWKDGLDRIEGRAGMTRCIDLSSIAKSIVADGGKIARDLLPGTTRQTGTVVDPSAEGDPFEREITLLAPRWHATASDVADRIQVDLMSAGYDVRIRKLARGEMGYKLASGEFDLFVGVWYHDPHFDSGPPPATGNPGRHVLQFYVTQVEPVPVLSSALESEIDALKSGDEDFATSFTEGLVGRALVFPLFRMDSVCVLGKGLVFDASDQSVIPDLSWVWLKRGQGR
jgi:ABC-type transport system substrate-binding protein